MPIKKVTYEFDPFELVGVEPPSSKREKKAALKEMAAYIRDEALGYIADSSSPVQGGSFKKSLTKEYRARKKAMGGSGVADLELSGSMLDDLDCTIKGDGNLEFGIRGKNAPKADGHNNFSGDSSLPAREFVPNADKNQTFKRDIIRGIKQIAEEFADGED